MQERTTPEHQAAITHFWARYVEILKHQEVAKHFQRWYVIRAQAYIDAHPDLRLKQHRTSDLTQYLNVLGQKSGLKDWQFKQAVDAIRILLVEMTELDWARAFDWDDWRESARSLPSSHPTVARDYDHVP
ncbi:MAG: hypothetical protein GY807_13710 [Gammaproteobacteria bacterium]|nr:hypothetical protein [Gammaproteobacteria bacterium]